MKTYVEVLKGARKFLCRPQVWYDNNGRLIEETADRWVKNFAVVDRQADPIDEYQEAHGACLLGAVHRAAGAKHRWDSWTEVEHQAIQRLADVIDADWRDGMEAPEEVIAQFNDEEWTNWDDVKEVLDKAIAGSESVSVDSK